MVIAACRDGYFGSSCNPCPPGFYGAECAGRCFPECPDADCDSVSGCLNDTGIEKIQFVTYEYFVMLVFAKYSLFSVKKPNDLVL